MEAAKRFNRLADFRVIAAGLVQVFDDLVQESRLDQPPELRAGQIVAKLNAASPGAPREANRPSRRVPTYEDPRLERRLATAPLIRPVQPLKQFPEGGKDLAITQFSHVLLLSSLVLPYISPGQLSTSLLTTTIFTSLGLPPRPPRAPGAPGGGGAHYGVHNRPP